MRKNKVWICFVLLLAAFVFPKMAMRADAGNNLKKNTEITVEFGEMPMYTGKQIVPEDFIKTHVYTDLDQEKKTEVEGREISYSFYRYREDKPDAPDESIDKLDWDETPAAVGRYWVKAKFLGDQEYHPSSSGYFLFEIKRAQPVLQISTDMTETTRIGDTIVISVEFQGAETEPEGFQPVGKAVFQTGGRYIDQAVAFTGKKAQVSYTLTAEPVNVKAEYVPGAEGENYTRAETVLEGLMGKKRDQAPIKIGCSPVAYGVTPFTAVVSGGSGTGEITYQSTEPAVAAVSEKGVITILHPGSTDIVVTKAEDETYAACTAAYRLEVSKGINPDKPRIPVLIDYTSSKIKVKETEGQEFSIDGGKTWTTKGVFKNLKEKKKYTVITRLTETELYQPGRTTKFLEITTKRKEEEKKGQSSGKQNKKKNNGKKNDDEKKEPEEKDHPKKQVSGGKKSQWNDLGGKTTGNGSDKKNGTGDGKQPDVQSTVKKTQKAEGAVKAVSAGSGNAETETETEMETEAEIETEAETETEEIVDNKIKATGGARPPRRMLSIPLLAGAAAAVLAASASVMGIVLIRKRRKTL